MENYFNQISDLVNEINNIQSQLENYENLNSCDVNIDEMQITYGNFHHIITFKKPIDFKFFIEHEILLLDSMLTNRIGKLKIISGKL